MTDRKPLPVAYRLGVTSARVGLVAFWLFRAVLGLAAGLGVLYAFADAPLPRWLAVLALVGCVGSMLSGEKGRNR